MKTHSATAKLERLAELGARLPYLPTVDEVEILLCFHGKLCFVKNGCKHYIVDSIRGHEKRADGMHFLVKWVGYGSKHNSWEPLSTVKKFECYRQYKSRHLS